ncbi:MAG: M48 family metalloprotease, partial [Acidobacteriota bacterium]
CVARDAERCAGWMAERDLGAGELDVYVDPRLRGYVQQIADRLARGTRLARAPRVVIADHDGTYAAFGDRLVIGRIAIEKLGTEAELAAIVAHELVHVEGRHATVSLFGPDTDAEWLAARRDAEAIADERAVALLERAGYAPAAMVRALAAELEADDDEHPPRAERIARAVALVAGRQDGFEGRSELLHHLDRMVVGRDTRLGARVGEAWVVAALGIALDLPSSTLVHVDGDTLVLRRGRTALTVYAIGAPWARELAAHLDDRASADTALGRVTVGVAPIGETAADGALAHLERAVLATLPQPAPGTRVVTVSRPHGGLVLELAPHADPLVRDAWLAGLRVATAGELAAAEPRRIALAVAPHAAPIRDLVAACPDPDAALALDDPDRRVDAGEPFKCTDR